TWTLSWCPAWCSPSSRGCTSGPTTSRCPRSCAVSRCGSRTTSSSAPTAPRRTSASPCPAAPTTSRRGWQAYARAEHSTGRLGRAWRLSGAVGHALLTHVPGAAGTAEHLAAGLDPVAQDPDPAVRARRRHHMGGALEAVEGAGALPLGHGEGLVVLVAAGVTRRHRALLSGQSTGLSGSWPS